MIRALIAMTIKRNIHRRRNVVLWLLLLVLSGSVLYRYVEYRCYVSEELIIDDRVAGRLADKINLNKASWSSIARLPGIGEAKARAIVKYRDEYIRINGVGSEAFKVSEDLQKVKGIGQKTVEQIKEYLVFEGL